MEESDIMDKDIKNPKTGNIIKVRTALQLPDDHPANKKAKEMVAKTGDVGGPAYPNVPKKKPSKKSKIKSDPFDKEKEMGKNLAQMDDPDYEDSMDDLMQQMDDPDFDPEDYGYDDEDFEE